MSENWHMHYGSDANDMFWTSVNGLQATIGIPQASIIVLNNMLSQQNTRNLLNKSFTQPSSLDILYDDAELRISLWKSLFGDSPMPNIETGAVEKYFGVLDRDIKRPVDPEEFSKILKRSRGR